MDKSRAVPTEEQRTIAASVVCNVVGHSIDGTDLWKKWVSEISQALADAAWNDPYVSGEAEMEEGSKP